MTDIAQELSRRASPRYLGQQAKETAREWTEQMTSSPLALALLGGALGAAIGGTLARNRKRQLASGERWREVRYPPGRLHYASAGPSGTVVRSGYEPGYVPPPGAYDTSDDERGAADVVREKISDGAQQLKEGAQQIKDKAGDVVDSIRERMPSADELRHTADENPGLVALGGFALGAIAALLLPVSRKEREMLEPVKQRAGEAIGSLGEKLGDTVQEAQHKLAPPDDRSRGAEQSGAEQRNQPSRTEQRTQPRRPEPRGEPARGYENQADLYPAGGYVEEQRSKAREPYASEDPVRGIGDDSGSGRMPH
jgi:X-X-X-Leu-X-X-Gly heptad repeat protein